MFPSPADDLLRPSRLEAYVLRCPIETPVETSFGVMRERPAVLVRVEDADGAHGWGEVWCNFPACGPEHRARLLETVIAPLVVGARFGSPQQAFDRMTAATAVLALQCGEPGPIAQAIAGVDLALWDLTARRAGMPLWRLLGGERDEIGVYASGLNPDGPEALVARRRAEGFGAFKLKIGFGEARDMTNLARVCDAAGDGQVMVDANQAWELPEAIRMVSRLGEHDLGWIEEPLRADRPWREWLDLKNHARAPLAAGENLAGSAFDAALGSGALGVLQPDVAKWGGISGCREVIARARQAGLRHCPHYLGAGIGLLHSGHLLAATGGDGMLEIDANDNPLRTLLMGQLAKVDGGRARLGAAPGIGVEPDPGLLRDLAPAGSLAR